MISAMVFVLIFTNSKASANIQCADEKTLRAISNEMAVSNGCIGAKNMAECTLAVGMLTPATGEAMAAARKATEAMKSAAKACGLKKVGILQSLILPEAVAILKNDCIDVYHGARVAAEKNRIVLNAPIEELEGELKAAEAEIERQRLYGNPSELPQARQALVDAHARLSSAEKGFYLAGSKGTETARRAQLLSRYDQLSDTVRVEDQAHQNRIKTVQGLEAQIKQGNLSWDKRRDLQAAVDSLRAENEQHARGSPAFREMLDVEKQLKQVRDSNFKAFNSNGEIRQSYKELEKAEEARHKANFEEKMRTSYVERAGKAGSEARIRTLTQARDEIKLKLTKLKSLAERWTQLRDMAGQRPKDLTKFAAEFANTAPASESGRHMVGEAIDMMAETAEKSAAGAVKTETAATIRQIGESAAKKAPAIVGGRAAAWILGPVALFVTTFTHASGLCETQDSADVKMNSDCQAEISGSAEIIERFPTTNPDEIYKWASSSDANCMYLMKAHAMMVGRWQTRCDNANGKILAVRDDGLNMIVDYSPQTGNIHSLYYDHFQSTVKTSDFEGIGASPESAREDIVTPTIVRVNEKGQMIAKDASRPADMSKQFKSVGLNAYTQKDVGVLPNPTYLSTSANMMVGCCNPNSLVNPPESTCGRNFGLKKLEPVPIQKTGTGRTRI